MKTRHPFWCALVLAITVCVTAGPGPAEARAAEAAGDIVSVRYVRLNVPWVITVNQGGAVEWNDGSDGHIFFQEPKTFRHGTITEAQWRELTALVTERGYAVEKPVEGIEPGLRLVVSFGDGRWISNCAPTPMDEEAVERFIPIEAFFLNLGRDLAGAEAGSHAFDPLYKSKK